jgi:hypothetical protein
MFDVTNRAAVWPIAAVAANLLVLLLLLTPTTRTPVVGAALRVALDPETGEFVPVTGLDKVALTRQMAQMLDRSAAGLHEQQLADGGFTVDLGGRFQSLMVATIDSTGRLSTDCLVSERDLRQLAGRHAQESTHHGETE